MYKNRPFFLDVYNKVLLYTQFENNNSFFIEKTIVDKHFQILNTKNMALNNDWDDLMAPVEWEESEIDSGYFDSDNEAGNPMS